MNTPAIYRLFANYDPAQLESILKSFKKTPVFQMQLQRLPRFYHSSGHWAFLQVDEALQVE